MQADLLVFDLDGTLIDSRVDLALSVNASREFAGLDPLPHETIFSYVGDGAPMLIRRALGPEASEDLVERCLRRFLDYYREHMLDNTYLYPGVREALDAFRDEGRAMAVLTNKPVRFSQLILEGLGLGGHFFRVYGGNSFETKKPDPEGLRELIRESKTAPERTLMVGDSGVDVRTARNAGARSCGVTYGLQPETFEDHPPDLLVDRLDELAGILRDGRDAARGPLALDEDVRA